MIDAKVSGEIILPRDTPVRITARIEKELSFGNPAYFRAVAMERSTHGIPERIEATRASTDGLHVPRGAVAHVRDIVGDELAFRDQRVTGELIDGGNLNCSLRPYQEEAVRLARKRTQGLVVIPCGGGKTTVGASLIHQIKRSTIVLVHTEDLHEQWMEVLEERLGIYAGSIIGSTWDPRTDGVTVASVPKLIRMLESPQHDRREQARQLLSSFGVVILDEAHHAPAKTFQAVLRACPARYRIGLTATPTRDDGLTKLVHWSFGATLLEITVDQLVSGGYLIRPDFKVHETSFRFESAKTGDKRRIELDRALLAHDDRVREIAIEAARPEWRDKITLVLSNRKEYAERLRVEIARRGIDAIVITSDTKKALRKKQMRDFRQGRIGMLIATSLADEGLDCPSLSRIILAWPEAPRSRTVQRIGRLMRPYTVKPLFVDVLDAKVPDLESRHEERRRIYRRLRMTEKGARNGNDDAQMPLVG